MYRQIDCNSHMYMRHTMSNMSRFMIVIYCKWFKVSSIAGVAWDFVVQNSWKRETAETWKLWESKLVPWSHRVGEPPRPQEAEQHEMAEVGKRATGSAIFYRCEVLGCQDSRSHSVTPFELDKSGVQQLWFSNFGQLSFCRFSNSSSSWATTVSFSDYAMSLPFLFDVGVGPDDVILPALLNHSSWTDVELFQNTGLPLNHRR